jgi:hypothetical protein
MLLGDLMTINQYQIPVKIIILTIALRHGKA